MKNSKKCPFLEEVVVRYCKAYPIKKMIPMDSLQREEPCIGCPNQCKIFQEVSSAGLSRFGEEGKNNYLRGFSYNHSVYYLPNHIWVKFIGKHQVKVGFDDFATKLLGEITALLENREVENIESINLKLKNDNVKIPINLEGRITGINQEVISNPEIILQDPYEEGWLFVIELATSKVNSSRFLGGAKAKEWFEKEIDSFQEIVQQECGVTIADGGELISNIREVLDENVKKQLLKRFLNIIE